MYEFRKINLCANCFVVNYYKFLKFGKLLPECKTLMQYYLGVVLAHTCTIKQTILPAIEIASREERNAIHVKFT